MAAICGKLKEEIIKKKDTITQWILPTLSFVIIVTVLVGGASGDMRRSIEKLVKSQFEDAATYYAATFFDAMHCLKESTIPVSDLLEQEKLESMQDIREAVPYLYALKSASAISDTWLVGADGKGVNSYGSDVSVEADSLKEAINSGQKQFILTTYGTDQRTMIAYVRPFDKTGAALVAYYDPAVFLVDTSVYRFDTHTWYAIMNEKGEIISLNAGNAKGISKENNVLDDLSGAVLYDYKYTQIISKISKKSTFDFTAEVNGEERYYVMTPARVNHWYFVLSAPQSYVEFLNQKSMNGIKFMILYVVIAVILFIVVIVGIALFNRKKAAVHNKELEVKADTDLLTELNNKMATERKIKEYIAMNPQSQAMLFVLDIDNFKKINDTMGHAFGDEVLKNIGMRLKAAFRSSDIVGRFGGDEFVLFLKDINTDELVKKEADKVLGVFKDFQVGSYTKYTVTASIGCSIYPRDAQDFESLFKAADVGVYKAKRAGKNQLAFYKEQENQGIGQDV